MWYVYFLELRNGDIYVGSTDNLRHRLDTHRYGGNTSTRAQLPIVLKSYVAVGSKSIAQRLERYFKSGSGKAIAMKRLW